MITITKNGLAVCKSRSLSVINKRCIHVTVHRLVVVRAGLLTQVIVHWVDGSEAVAHFRKHADAVGYSSAKRFAGATKYVCS